MAINKMTQVLPCNSPASAPRNVCFFKSERSSQRYSARSVASSAITAKAS